MGILASNFIYSLPMGGCVEPRNVEKGTHEREEKFFERERLQDICDVEVEGGLPGEENSKWRGLKEGKGQPKLLAYKRPLRRSDT